MGLTWNPVSDVEQMLQYHFMANAFLAGLVASVVAGCIGYFIVVRAQTFAGHALSHVSFAGATGALLFGFLPVIGLLAVGAGAGCWMGLIEDQATTRRGRSDDVAVTAVFTFGLGLGLFFLQLYPGQAENVYGLLFGNVLGVSDQDVLLIGLVGLAALGALAVIARPLLFASTDPEVARSRGVPVRGLSIALLVLTGVAVAEAVQFVGILLIFALLVLPAATAQTMTARPALTVCLSVALAVAFTWLGISIAFFAPPAYSVVGFYVTSIGFGTYVVAMLFAAGLRRWRQTRL
ncbi:MAG TPA: metal ABC transporter permease [Chloroflexota bacterium]|jgi:zinc/manganese transport system permease protein|nr:metal ABC transporter permease [Chloroflexota bacterium]